MLSIINAKYIEDYILELNFNNNKTGKVNLKDYIFNNKIKSFHKLQDKKVFKNFNVDYTIKWDNDLDIAPEYLFFKAFENNSELKKQFLDWGYIQ